MPKCFCLSLLLPSPQEKKMEFSRRALLELARRKRSGLAEHMRNRTIRVPERHRRKCVLCRHPQREAIEAAYLDGQSPEALSAAHGLANKNTVYRHVRAIGLCELRRLRLLYAAEKIISQCRHASHSSDYTALLGAVEYSARAAARADRRRRAARKPRPNRVNNGLNAVSNRQNASELETDANA
jgi:hypothetical protein